MNLKRQNHETYGPEWTILHMLSYEPLAMILVVVHADPELMIVMHHPSVHRVCHDWGPMVMKAPLARAQKTLYY